MEKQIAKLETSMDFLIAEVKEMKEWIKDRDGRSDNKYAPKWIMIPFGVVGTAMLTAVVGALLGLILVPHAQAIAMIYIKLLT